MKKNRTTEDFLAELRKADRTVADWCREHGFSQSLAYRVLRGQNPGKWGETRRIVKAMNLKLPDMAAGARARMAAAE